MTSVHEKLDHLHFTESTFGQPRFVGSEFRIPVRNLFPLAGYPELAPINGPYAGELVFSGVQESRRKIIEYIGDPRAPLGFAPPHEIIDRIPSSPVHEALDVHEFGFEGCFDSPPAWVDEWRIKASSFRFEAQDYQLRAAS